MSPRSDAQDAWVKALIDNPGATLAPSAPAPDYPAQIAAIETAIAETERDGQRLRNTINAEAMARQRPARIARAREMVSRWS